MEQHYAERNRFESLPRSRISHGEAQILRLARMSEEKAMAVLQNGHDGTAGDPADDFLRNVMFMYGPLVRVLEELFDNPSFPFFKQDAWKETRKQLIENPVQPDTVMGIVMKLFHEGAPLNVIGPLLFRESGEQDVPWWPDHPLFPKAAAKYYLSKTDPKRAMQYLTDEKGEMKFPDDPDAVRTFFYTCEADGNIGAIVEFTEKHPHDIVFQHIPLMQCVVRAYIGMHKYDVLKTFLSIENPAFKREANFRVCKVALNVLEKKNSFGLMLSVCEQLLLVQPKLRTSANFVGFFSLALNEARRYHETIELLSSVKDKVRMPRFKTVDVVKNLCYALVRTRRSREANSILSRALVEGLPSRDCIHIQNFLRGSPLTGSM